MRYAFAGLFSVLAFAASPAVAQQVPADFTVVVKEKVPAVVAITTKQRVEEQEQAQALPEDLPFREFFRRYYGERPEPRRQQRQALGSGFVISPDGHIITNNHVVEDAAEIHVVFGDRTNVPATLVGRDPATDIAVLKIDPRPDMTIANWGDSDTAEPGSWAIAIGSPFGLGGTVTVGVVSARSRDIRSGPYDDYIQTDASINRGNSGGPLFNARGEVIGVNTAIFSPSGVNIGIGFAVPSNTARTVADQLIRTGRVERGYVGLRLQEITPAIAQALGRSDEKGVLVASVEPGGPAEKAGFRSGDVITQFDGKPVESGRELSRAVAAMKPGTQAPATVIRDGKPEELTVTIGQRSGEQTARSTPPGGADDGKRLGLALSPIPDAARGQLGLDPGMSGVLIQRVDPNSPAAEAGLRQGDVIVSADNQPVGAPADVAKAWTEAQGQKRPILLRVKRDDQYLFVAIEG
ncbi:DegQ family serine endoprotease [Microvirga makkahensis]|uniref:Probable periplasmic serine endoprotease DegP-like n=1 Tax=Microvirga makkahensis TaxID=1128670 RepID=A0A7X3MTU1_9HYPH|nr:DegQ family serine endoprotease [Microvirga makkahensis]MXQ13087.1 Do family serine endopeptidase [Microvirga makkahensis]